MFERMERRQSPQHRRGEGHIVPGPPLSSDDCFKIKVYELGVVLLNGEHARREIDRDVRRQASVHLGFPRVRPR